MLVLSRKKNESIVINNDITVTVVEIRGDKVRLGIVAPKEVPVHRQEVYEAIHGKPADIEANGRAVIEAIIRSRPATAKGRFIESCTLSSTFSPGIRIDIAPFLSA